VVVGDFNTPLSSIDRSSYPIGFPISKSFISSLTIRNHITDPKISLNINTKEIPGPTAYLSHCIKISKTK
jgi:hypothetical protein